ncbi:uncharacterized protein VTP21DRAFT_9271 [Calcarisporiella thermophila]|uniref:uncharacterized protein n=1 Tax=Calcarisporiella thermophila TaxID=911321 RepID=UPI00374226CE
MPPKADMEPDSDYYLQPDFDPTSLRMAELRGILLKHGVETKASAKKGDLVDLFREHIGQKAPSILKERRKVRPSGAGIVNMPGSSLEEAHEKHDSADDFIAPAPPQATPRQRGRPAKKKSLVPDGSESETNAHPKTTPARRGRKSEILQTPVASERESNGKHASDRSPFTFDNPFQSGGESSPDKTRRRRTIGDARSRSRSRTGRSSSVSRKYRASMPGDPDGLAQPASPKFTLSPTAAGSDGEHPIRQRLRASSRATDTGPLRRRRSSPLVIEKEEYSLSSIWLVVLFILLAYGLYYRNARFAAGYCDSDVAGSTPLQDPVKNDTLLHSISAHLRPSCIPCPEHATCRDGHFACDENFVEKSHPFSFGKLLPLAPTCVPDITKQMYVQYIVDVVRGELAKHAGQVKCGYVRPPKEAIDAAEDIEQNYVLQYGIPAETLRKTMHEVFSTMTPALSEFEFDKYWRLAMLDLSQRRDKVSVGLFDGERWLASLEPSLPFACRVKYAFINALLAHTNALLGTLGAVMGVLILRKELARRSRDALIVRGLVESAFRRLEEQERLHYVDPVQYSQSGLAVAHLRDALLADEHDPKRRNALWTRVQRIVEGNSNVRAITSEVRGEQHRVWMWVGAFHDKMEQPIYPSSH